METLEDARWLAVRDRDETLSGVFVYAVTSTGIYCRPGCRARRPLRENVKYFATPASAVDAGFRACKRCRPDAVEVVDPMVKAVGELCRWLELAGNDLTIAAMAQELGYNERHLRRRFREIVGISPAAYARAHKALRAREALRSGMAVSQAVVDAGYGSFRAFYEHGASTLGMTPNRFRSGGVGEWIRFTSVETPRGVVLIACTARGVCDVRIGNEEEPLIVDLRASFPRAMVQRDDEGLADVANAIVLGLQGRPVLRDLPLDVEGTAFQIRVWEALREIPVGETRSYAQVATAIGAPAAVRAVASACAANRTALVIPCHRVLRSDGSLGGYRWGVELKAALLEDEYGVLNEHHD